MVIRPIAFYLPQFHPIPENDQWWGRGFTEWTNVANAKPLFKGHYQPRIPADLGFYDLRVNETRCQQATLAAKVGIEGFCYYHYWFAGKKILERPFNEVLNTGKPNFPFCLCWANESWTGIWHGSPDKMLIEQTYPGIEDHIQHFEYLLPAFKDPRYIKKEGKPVFVVYKPTEIVDAAKFADLWNSLAVKNGLPGIYIIGYSDRAEWNPIKVGFNAKIFDFGFRRKDWVSKKEPLKWIKNFLGLWTGEATRAKYSEYSDSLAYSFLEQVKSINFDVYSAVVHAWDNTPRSKNRGFLFYDSSPEKFDALLQQLINIASERYVGETFIFLKSWNEWAEGNYFEPDMKYGYAWLDVLAKNFIENSEGTE